ncbi:uncharacterized protein LOC131801659 [Musca domestica]|uniref:Uncharacterized protein LOC131801659 n=1 Tax=Musca domestica TaxID=7370 RepID=A0ABM3USM9_MUSDO|nr:uncharacterized protein LOC131801659 [Musca domestica]
MSHLLKRTKKSCIKLIRKISNKQIFLKRLEEEDISTDVDISVEAKERDINQNENICMQPQQQKLSTCYKKHKDKSHSPLSSTEDVTKERTKRKLPIHLEDLSSDKPVLQSLTSKLFLTADGYEFQRLQQLRSDAASEIIPYDPEFAKCTARECSRERPTSLFSEEEDFDDVEKKIEVVFEKVKYKEDVRYLRHTPSTCSLDNYIIRDEDDNEELTQPTDEEHILNTTNLMQNQNNNNNTICRTRNSFNGIDNQMFTSSMPGECLADAKREDDTTTRGLQNPAINRYACEFQESSDNCDSIQLELQHLPQQPPPQQHHYFHTSSQPSNQNLLPLNVSLGCITDGNYHQLFIGEQRDAFYKLTPVVKWDINGNSLEDDDFPVFDANHHLNNSPAKSSLRSSSTTLETWLEVE